MPSTKSPVLKCHWKEKWADFSWLAFGRGSRRPEAVPCHHRGIWEFPKSLRALGFPQPRCKFSGCGSGCVSLQPFLGTPSRFFTALCYSAWSYAAEQPCNPTKTHRERVRSNTGLKTHPAAQLPSTKGAKAFLEVLSNNPTARDPCLDPCCALWIPLPSLVSHILSPAISAPRASSRC